MLENIHDIAPGPASPSRPRSAATWLSPRTSTALADSGHRNIIVDDLGFADEPLFQDGLISQAIDTVIAQGVTYFSAAGNAGRRRLPVDVPRARTARSPASAPGTFMNFNPNGGTTLELPITTDGANAEHHLRVRPAVPDPGAGGSPARDVERQHLHAQRATGAVSSPPRNNNNVAIQEPLQFVTIPAPGSYYDRDPGGFGAEPGARRILQRSTKTHLPSASNSAVPAALIIRARRALRRRPTRSAWARLRGGRRRPSRAEPAGQRAVQLGRARRFTSSTPNGSRTGAARRWSRTRRSRPLTAAIRRSSRPAAHQYDQSPVPRRAGDSDQPGPAPADPADLLRHFVGRAQCGGGGGPDAAEGPAAHAGRRSARG